MKNVNSKDTFVSPESSSVVCSFKDGNFKWEILRKVFHVSFSATFEDEESFPLFVGEDSEE